MRDATLEVPAGCAVSIVSEECSAYLMLKGIMNLEEELAKLDKRKGDTTKAREDLNKRMALDNYKVRVGTCIRAPWLFKSGELENLRNSVQKALLDLSEARFGIL